MNNLEAEDYCSIPVERRFTEDVFLHQTLGSRKLNDLLHHLKLPVVAGSIETQPSFTFRGFW